MATPWPSLPGIGRPSRVSNKYSFPSLKQRRQPELRFAVGVRRSSGTSSTTTFEPQLPRHQRKDPGPLLGGAVAVDQRFPRTIRQGRAVGVELNVADDPIEQRRCPRHVVEAVALRPAADVAEPDRFLQQSAFVRLNRQSRRARRA